MSAENFTNLALPLLNVTEGGEWADPRGGLTSRGITQDLYNSWRRAHGQAVQAVTLATDDERRAILHDWFWQAANCDAMPYPYDVAVFVQCVNEGKQQAVKLAQRALGVDDDGEVGDRTLEAMRAACNRQGLLAFLRENQRFYLGLADPENELGWSDRLFTIAMFCALP
jgi:lysozyme family protein